MTTQGKPIATAQEPWHARSHKTRMSIETQAPPDDGDVHPMISVRKFTQEYLADPIVYDEKHLKDDLQPFDGMIM